MNELTNQMVVSWLTEYAKVLEENKTKLNELDREIGDGDHGENMARGFTAVAGKVTGLQNDDIGTILKSTAMTLISTVGGASGPLYGSFFLKAAMTATGKQTLNPDEVKALWEAGLESVIARGKASVGDKTMVDAMRPAVQALGANLQRGLKEAAGQAALAARSGAESTISIVAKKGRASYLGERSIGHMDPGCLSTQLLFESFYKIF